MYRFLQNDNLSEADIIKNALQANSFFVGRSLDTYISKLRKKLSDDESIKLTNVHGIGYMLEVKNTL